MQPKGQARQSWDDFTVILHSFTPFHLCKMLYCGHMSKVKVQVSLSYIRSHTYFVFLRLHEFELFGQ